MSVRFKRPDQFSEQSVEIRLKGSPISEGVAIGSPFFLVDVEDNPPEFSISAVEVEQEIARFRQALLSSREEIEVLKIRFEEQKVWEGAAIMDCQLQMLQDPSITTAIEQKIRDIQKNTESVFHYAILEYKKKFSKSPDDYFKERFKDVQDISNRIMHHLGGRKRFSLLEIPEGSIVFAKELVPSDTAEIHLHNIKGFVTEVGGEASHVAIMARAQGIPYVASVNFGREDYKDLQSVIIDGSTGDVILHPSKKTLAIYQLKKMQMENYLKRLEVSVALGSETIDGYKVRLSANIELGSEFDMLHEHGSSGVGLFRSESLFLSQNSFPSEQQQFLVYKRMIENMRGLPVVIRTFDVGGDKLGDYYLWKSENNPFLGCRAIRFMLKEREIFKTQLRAILRASAYGDVSILFPMISGIAELREAKEVVQEASQELKANGVVFNSQIRLGCMIEVPSAALTCDVLAKECDFLSIGTNDLVQYCLAVDRGNQSVSYLYTPTHPSVIRLIKMVVSEANRHKIPVTMCGEMAADPKLTALLLGLGVQEFSVTSRYLPIIKSAIRKTYIFDAFTLAEKVLAMTTPQEIYEFLVEEYDKQVFESESVPVIYS